MRRNFLLRDPNGTFKERRRSTEWDRALDVVTERLNERMPVMGSWKPFSQMSVWLHL